MGYQSPCTRASSLLLPRRFRSNRTRTTNTATPITASETPTPIPALAPVLKPEELLVAGAPVVPAVGTVVMLVVASVELVGNPVDEIVEEVVEEIVDEELDRLAEVGKEAPWEMLK